MLKFCHDKHFFNKTKSAKNWTDKNKLLSIHDFSRGKRIRWKKKLKKKLKVS